jgi:hypothetical protein
MDRDFVLFVDVQGYGTLQAGNKPGFWHRQWKYDNEIIVNCCKTIQKLIFTESTIATLTLRSYCEVVSQVKAE